MEVSVGTIDYTVEQDEIDSTEPPVSKFYAGNFVPVSCTDIPGHVSMCLGFQPPATLPNYSCCPDFPTLSSSLALFVCFMCVNCFGDLPPPF